MDKISNIIEVMRERRSVRTFDGRAVEGERRADLKRFINEASSAQPFGRASYGINIVDVDTAGEFRPGTYGVIKGARTYLTMTVGSTRIDALTAGFVMEEVVLRAWQAGLGTCWIGGTFRPSTFVGATPVPEGQTLRIVVPVGVPADRVSFMDRMARMMAGSDRRKDFCRMFFCGDWSRSLDPDSVFGDALKAMRLAPSSTNSQPWRVLVIGGTAHFYGLRGRFSDIDMGIGLCHFALYEHFAGALGTFFDNPEHPAAPDTHTDYICSYKR